VVVVALLVVMEIMVVQVVVDMLEVLVVQRLLGKEIMAALGHQVLLLQWALEEELEV
jgi:hypothetical protein